MTFKKTDNDLYSFKIKSSSTKKVWDNEAKALVDVDGKPEVFVISPEGKKIDIDPKTVGNESDVTAKLELYDTSKGGKGTRLLGVRVDNLLEYTPGPTVIDNGVEPF